MQPVVTTKQYTVSEAVITALKSCDCDITQLQTYTGNRYQQLLHQELLTIAETATQINQNSPLFFQQETLFACAASAVAYNNAGSAYEATQIADFCWALLDYGGAILEGAITGASATILHAAAHPFETTATVFAGQYLLAYQLSRLVYDLLKIGVIATYDADTASQQWETLTQPLTDLYDTLTAAETTTRDKIKLASTIATSFYAQTKLIGGLQKFCGGMLKQVKFFQRNNPQASPVEYLATTEGQLYKAVTDVLDQGKKGINSFPASTTFLLENLEKAIEYATTENSLSHFFKAKHNFKELVEKLGDEKSVVCAVLHAANGKLPVDGFFKDVPIVVEGFTVYIRGRVLYSIPRLGTMFIK